jgi:uncharacterized membrane protein YbhN (UPF0104 family)
MRLSYAAPGRIPGVPAHESVAQTSPRSGYEALRGPDVKISAMTHADENKTAALHRWSWSHWALSYVLAVVLIAMILAFFVSDWSLLLRLLSADPRWLLGVFLMIAAGMVSQTVFLGILTNELGWKLAWKECFSLVAVANMLSMLAPPVTGGAYRAFYLRSRHGIGVLPFVSGSALYTVVSVLVWCVAAAIGVTGSALLEKSAIKSLLFATLLVAVALVAAWQMRTVFRVILRERGGGLAQLVDEKLGIALSRRIGTAAAIVLLLSAPVQILGFCLVLHVFELSVGVSDGISILAFQQLSSVIGLTPGGIGIQEGAGLLVSRELGMDLAEMAAAFSLMRVARVLLSILVGGVCWWLLKTGSAPASPVRDKHDLT